MINCKCGGSSMCLSASLHVFLCITHMLTEPMEARPGHWMPWDWKYKWLSAAMRMLGVEPPGLLVK